MRRQLFICLLLAGITLAGFWPVGRLGFTIYDDDDYVVKNPHVQAGITANSVGWAFTTMHASNWHPITWLSHMLDCQLFGLKAGDHHWMNLWFHVANVVVVFLVLSRMTGFRADESARATATPAGLHQNETAPAPAQPRSSSSQAGAVWCSALVAALFALHPLRVESVVWISERKDVLSAFFMMLTLLAWVRYAQKRSRVEPSSLRFAAPKSRGSSTRAAIQALDPRRWTLDYCMTLVFFALGLMSKPMLVTLPLILLLLDFWPLGRMAPLHYCASARQASDKRRGTRLGLPVLQSSTFNCLLFEKLPFFLLCVASCIVTFQAQSAAGSVISLNNLPWDWRIENSLASYAAYLGKIAWPENLAVFYPYRQIPPGEVFGSGLLLTSLSVFCLWRARRQPYLFVGWFWFLVMLVPVIGLVQVGKQSMADRYTYLPSIGLFIIVAWGMAGIAAISNLWRTGMTLGAVGLLLACLLGTRRQLGYWQDNVKLFSHSVEVTRENNFGGYLLLGNAYGVSGNLDGAAESYQSALRINPNFEEAHSQLGCVLFVQKKFEAARVQFGEVLRLNPHNADAHRRLGDALAAENKTTEAVSEYSTALQLKPDDVTTRESLALILAQKGETDKALDCLHEALKIQPTPGAHAQVAAILDRQGEFPDAVGHYREALHLQPDSPDILNNLAWLLATCPDTRIRDGPQAVGFAERACKLTDYKQTIMVGTLAAAYAEAGRFDDAIATAQKACALASESGEQELLKKNQELLILYRAHQPYHEAP